jgi:glycosyltransferase involved in cell wall biosynthesis
MSGMVSVIVPVYNVEPYLRQCVDSILTQTYGDLEIILVDDASPDNCGEICDGYAAREPRVKVIHQQNRGLSGARNAGIDIAAGEYLFFLDSDDWLDPSAIETLLADLTGSNAGAAIGGYAYAYADGRLDPAFTWEGVLCLDAEEAVARFCSRGTFAVSAWGKLYRREIFDKTRYPEGKIYEDAFVLIDVLLAAGKVTVRSAPLVYYRQRKSGIIYGLTRTYSPSLTHGKEAWERNVSQVRELLPRQADAVEAIYWTSCIAAASNLALCNGYSQLPEFLEARNVIRRRFKDIRKCVILSKKEKLLAYLLRFCPSLFRRLLILAGRRRKSAVLYD